MRCGRRHCHPRFNSPRRRFELTYGHGVALRKRAIVVEADVVPTTHVIPINVLAPIGDGHTEALGNRIVEVPEDVTRTDLRDSQSGYVAYVPKGSIERGRVLVTTGGGGRTIACSPCHGKNLKGIGAISSDRESLAQLHLPPAV